MVCWYGHIYPLAFQKIPGIPGIIFNFNQEPRIAPQLQPDLTQNFVCSLWDIYIWRYKSPHVPEMHWTYTPHWPWWPLIFSTKIFYRGSPVFFYLDLGVTAMAHTPKPNSTVGADGPLPPNRNKKLDPRLNSRYWAAMSKADSAAVRPK